MQIPTKNIFVHALCWVVYLLTLILGSSSWDSFFWASFVSNNLPVILLFYFNVFFVFPKYLDQKRYFPLFAWLLLCNVLVVLLRFTLLLLLTGGSLDDLLDARLGSIILNLFRANILFTGISLAYWYYTRSLLAERHQQKLEKEISEARLSGLKNQINPHFLYQ